MSGAGKSTIATDLVVLIKQCSGREAILLDGDVVRTHLSPGLGFTKSDRDENVRRLALMAADIVGRHELAICALISPYRAARDMARATIGSRYFTEVFVNTPLAVCERRDPKGLYKRARRGELQHFTGIDDPYEVPLNPDVVLDTEAHGPRANAETLMKYLTSLGCFNEPTPIEAENIRPQSRPA